MELNVIEKTLRPSYYCQQMNKKKNFVAIGPHAYYQFIRYLDDDYLSEWELFKIKTCNRFFCALSIATPCAVAGLFYYLAPKLLGQIDGYRSHFKTIRLGVGISIASLVYAELNMYPLSNRHFHELITQPEPRGKFVRQTLKETHPRIWSLMSKQLNELGYNFREMNEYSNKITMPEITTKFDNSNY